MGTRSALVLSAGGMFGAWQAGAWKALAEHFTPDLIVGASVGSLNGYAIAGGASVEELCEFWLREETRRFNDLAGTIRILMDRFSPRIEYAVVVTDLLRLKPRIFSAGEITWRHLAASCAIPCVLPQQRIGGRIYTDGGLLNPLPVWAAVELGATHIIALHALPEVPSALLKPFILGFRHVAGHNPPLAPATELAVLKPGRRLGSVRDALRWNRQNMERWIEQGSADAAAALKNISILNCLRR